MTQPAAYTAVLQRVTSWPIDQQIALAQDVLETVSERVSTSANPRPSFERARGIARSEERAPSDEEVKQWIDERRKVKFG